MPTLKVELMVELLPERRSVCTSNILWRPHIPEPMFPLMLSMISSELLSKSRCSVNSTTLIEEASLYSDSLSGSVMREQTCLIPDLSLRYSSLITSDFFVDVVWRDLNWANVVKFKLRYLVSLALLAGHGVGRSASMGKWRWLEAVRCVACAEDGIRRMLLKVAFVVEVEGIGGILIR